MVKGEWWMAEGGEVDQGELPKVRAETVDLPF